MKTHRLIATAILFGITSLTPVFAQDSSHAIFSAAPGPESLRLLPPVEKKVDPVVINPRPAVPAVEVPLPKSDPKKVTKRTKNKAKMMVARTECCWVWPFC